MRKTVEPKFQSQIMGGDHKGEEVMFKDLLHQNKQNPRRGARVTDKYRQLLRGRGPHDYKIPGQNNDKMRGGEGAFVTGAPEDEVKEDLMMSVEEWEDTEIHRLMKDAHS